MKKRGNNKGLSAVQQGKQKIPGEASWSMLPARIECFKTWCFSFQKQWTQWHYNPLFFRVKWYIPVFIGQFTSAEMAFGCSYCGKQRSMWRAWMNMQPSLVRKISTKMNQILPCYLLQVQWSMVLKINNIYKHLMGHYKNTLHFTL